MTSKPEHSSRSTNRWERLPFYLLLLTASILGAATFIEDARGTVFIHETVYGASWFKVLWAVVVATAAWTMWRRRLWRHAAVFALHLSLMLILAGGLTTALTHQTGMLHVRQGTTELSFLDKERRLQPLPFAVRLDSFYIKNYPGTQAHQDYVSEVTVKGLSGEDSVAQSVVISMNRIMQRDGYRLYQSSYDPDNLGTWLTVTYDPYGTPVAYFGFFLFGLSSVIILLQRKGKKGQVATAKPTTPTQNATAWKMPVATWTASFLLLCAFLSYFCWFNTSGTDASTTGDVPCISREKADSLATRLVVWNDRVCPFNTLATDFVKKLYGKPKCKGYMPEQVVASWMLYPETWNRVPLIKIKDEHLRRHLGLKDKYAAMVDLFDAQGQYRLQPLYNREKDKTSKLSKAVRETDEKAGLIMMLLEGTLIEQPTEKAKTQLSDTHIKAELIYNRTPFVTILFMMNLTLGFVFLIFFIIEDVARKPLSRWLTLVVHGVATTLLQLSLLILGVAYVLRWYISGRVPLGNGFETMMFVALVIIVLALWLSRRTTAALPFGFLLSGFTLLVSHLGLMNPQITSLMPVLNSPWLSSHVSIIMISYALLAFTFVLSLIALFTEARSSATSPVGKDGQVHGLLGLSLQLLRPAVMLLGVGIFLGAVWANVSWGTYWSWDPKEVWALITLIIYALPLHRQSLAYFQRPRVYHIYMLFAFLTVIMTYFGVNFVLGGMHSYAN